MICSFNWDCSNSALKDTQYEQENITEELQNANQIYH